MGIEPQLFTKYAEDKIRQLAEIGVLNPLGLSRSCAVRSDSQRLRVSPSALLLDKLRYA
jgi:hypothetical protein